MEVGLKAADLKLGDLVIHCHVSIKVVCKVILAGPDWIMLSPFNGAYRDYSEKRISSDSYLRLSEEELTMYLLKHPQ